MGVGSGQWAVVSSSPPIHERPPSVKTLDHASSFSFSPVFADRPSAGRGGPSADAKALHLGAVFFFFSSFFSFMHRR
jgi:hypothetical protein